MATYNLGGFEFASKKAIQDEIRRMFKAYAVDEELDAPDTAIVKDLINWHPSAAQKIGVGIAKIVIHIPKPWTSKGLLIVRVDGSTTDISYKACLTPSAGDAYVKFKEACRAAIVPQVVRFKAAAFCDRDLVLCPATQRWINASEAAVDHYPVPFIDLVDRYVAESGIDVDKTAVTGSGDNETQTRFIDPRLENDWANWHYQQAELRIICGRENSRLGAHGRRSA